MINQLWLLVSRYNTTRSHYHKDYYKDLLRSKNFMDLHKDIIDKDIERTKGSKYEKDIMKNILYAYSRRNSKVGYVQGQNFIVRLILDLIPNEEEVFWLYCYIIEECFTISYFMNLKSLMLDSLIFRILLKAIEPKLAIHLQTIPEFDLDFVTFKWFLALYTDSSLSREYIHRIYDLLVLGDRFVYFKAGFVILSELASKLLKYRDIAEIYDVVNHMDQHLKITPDKFIQRVNNIYINSRILEIIKVSNQHKLQMAHQRMLKEKPELAESKKTRTLPPPPCKKHTIVCSERPEIKGPELDFFTFSTKNILKNKIFDYFSDQNVFWEENKRKSRPNAREEGMILHRSKHTCNGHVMRASMRDLERQILTNDYSVDDLKKDIHANYSEIYEEIKQAEKDLMEKDGNEDFESDEEDIKTLPRASSRMIKQRTGGFTYQKER
jgi:hypothetical protein